MSWTDEIDAMLDDCHADLSTCSVEIAPAPDGSDPVTGLPATPAATGALATAVVREGATEMMDGSVVRTRTYDVRVGRTGVAGVLPAPPQQGDRLREWRGEPPAAGPWHTIAQTLVGNDGRSVGLIVRQSRTR